MHSSKIPGCIVAGALLLSAGTVFASPTAGSPYFTDTANEYVQDATSDGMANLNMVLCIMNAMSPSDMLTQHGVLNTSTGITEVKYVALVDKNKCDSRSRSSSSNSSGGDTGAAATPNFMTALVDITRDSSPTSPMIGKVWMSLTEQGRTVQVSVKITATTSPSVLPPYGRLRMDYVGYVGSTLQFNGFIDANGGAVSYVETGANSSNVALNINAVDTNTGNGAIHAVLDSNGTPQPVTYTFAYNTAAFARNDGSGDLCFDRQKANANRSVWRYGVYDATTGARVDQTNPGFPLTGVTGSGLSGISSGQQTFGFASYWGVNFGGIDPTLLSVLPDGQVTAITNIVDGRPNNSTHYNLFKSSGKLTKWSQGSTTLGAIAGIPFTYFAEGCKLVNGGTGSGSVATPSGAACNGTPLVPDYRNWLLVWDSALVVNHSGTNTTGNFKIVGYQDCSSGNCIANTSGGVASVVQAFKQMPINAWSDTLGNLTIPIPAGDSMATGGSVFHADSDPVYFFSQSNVLPGDPNAPTSLHCLSNCPTATSLAAALASTTSPFSSPFASPTNVQWGTGSSEVNYTFDNSGLKSNGTLVTLSAPLSDPMFQGGVNSGRLFTTDLGTATNSCPAGVAFCEPSPSPSTPFTYYTYQTGANQWNQAMWLTNNGNVVNFDPPVQVSYTVPTGVAYGSWATKVIQLQFNGFGNLYGIPGNCVDPSTNATVPCTPSTRYVPAFSLADGTSLTIGTHAVLTRALDSELRLGSINCGTAGLSTVGVTTAQLPTASPNNPTISSDPTYIGTAPSIVSAPAVIDGVLQ